MATVKGCHVKLTSQQGDDFAVKVEFHRDSSYGNWPEHTVEISEVRLRCRQNVGSLLASVKRTQPQRRDHYFTALARTAGVNRHILAALANLLQAAFESGPEQRDVFGSSVEEHLEFLTSALHRNQYIGSASCVPQFKGNGICGLDPNPKQNLFTTVVDCEVLPASKSALKHGPANPKLRTT